MLIVSLHLFVTKIIRFYIFNSSSAVHYALFCLVYCAGYDIACICDYQ